MSFGNYAKYLLNSASLAGYREQSCHTQGNPEIYVNFRAIKILNSDKKQYY